MKGAKGKKPAPSTAKKDVKETLSKKGEETNLKRKTKAEKAKKSRGRERTAKKDSNKPKRPPTTFFVFMEEFRKTYQAEHPGTKSVATVGKAGGEKWKSMSELEKAPFVAKAARRKAEYDKSIQAYNEKSNYFISFSGGNPPTDTIAHGQQAAAEESDKSKSEINDEEESGDADEELEEEEEEE